MYSHFAKCFIAGLVAVLPIGGLIFLIVRLDQSFRAIVKDTPFDYFGVSLILVVIAVYLLGLTVTTFVGRWLWRSVDYVLHQVPGLTVLYATLKQILGYGSGKDALFRNVVFIKDTATGALEMGLVTEEMSIENQGRRLCVFIPGSPNPALGRMVLVEPARVIESKIPVDVALKALLSTGKTGL
ncbi:MAG TPA: DUF502 domain-containing protein [Planctomycetota bacterium]|nr:DUF502 domain-containing protein [Planctomycetota bacterium]